MGPMHFGVGAGIPRPIAWITDGGGEYPPLQCPAHYFFKCQSLLCGAFSLFQGGGARHESFSEESKSFPPQKPNTRSKYASLNSAETEKLTRVDIVVYRERVLSVCDVVEPAAQSEVEAQQPNPPLGVQIQ